LDLYRKQSEGQHVALFLRKVGRYLKQSLKGRWFCKLEFQRGGWVHWHIIILDVERIPHAVATLLWGRGHVWLRRLNAKNVRYCTKYLSKGGDVPAWMYFERPRSLKVVRVSSGFWGQVEEPATEEADEDDPYDQWGPGEQRIRDVYEPIGVRLDRSRERIVVRDVATGTYFSRRVDFAEFLVALLQRGLRICGRSGAWLRVDTAGRSAFRSGPCVMRHARAAAEAAAGLVVSSSHCDGLADGGREACEARRGPSAALHLRRTGNPDGIMHRLIDRWFREDALGVRSELDA
ncbi:MAG: hypothetical protein IT439_08430, partial [Phycisphaerales bacterium]|nr:hypothetical protein [Phycisphaerales bacterium]